MSAGAISDIGAECFLFIVSCSGALGASFAGACCTFVTSKRAFGASFLDNRMTYCEGCPRPVPNCTVIQPDACRRRSDSWTVRCEQRDTEAILSTLGKHLSPSRKSAKRRNAVNTAMSIADVMRGSSSRSNGTAANFGRPALRIPGDFCKGHYLKLLVSSVGTLQGPRARWCAGG